MLSETLHLKTEQLLKNRLWRHSITVDRGRSSPGEIAELLAALIEGLEEEVDGTLRAYVVLSGRAVDRHFFESVERAECARFPLVGDFETDEDDPDAPPAPFAFHLNDPALLGEFVGKYWGKDSFAVFFSPLPPLDFFAALRRFGLVRREGGSLIWAPYWNPASFERFLVESESPMTDRVFRHVAYYLAEVDEGTVVRVYCRGRSDEGDKEIEEA